MLIEVVQFVVCVGIVFCAMRYSYKQGFNAGLKLGDDVSTLRKQRKEAANC